jgi:hypothetical protein
LRKLPGLRFGPAVARPQKTTVVMRNGDRVMPMAAFGTMNSDVREGTVPGYRRPNFCDLIAANPLGG